MKKLIIPVLVIMISASGAIAQEQNQKIHWFVGGNALISNTIWSDDVADAISPIKLAETNFGLGAEAGGKFGGYNNIYNLGLTFNYDYLFDAGADIPSPYDSIFSEITTGFSAISASFDNYVRIDTTENKRTDLVLGIGYTRATERGAMKTTAYGQLNGYYDDSSKEDGDVVVFKLGVNSELTNYLDWSVSLRAFVPTNSDSDMDLAAILSAGLRFKF